MHNRSVSLSTNFCRIVTDYFDAASLSNTFNLAIVNRWRSSYITSSCFENITWPTLFVSGNKFRCFYLFVGNSFNWRWIKDSMNSVVNWKVYIFFQKSILWSGSTLEMCLTFVCQCKSYLFTSFSLIHTREQMNEWIVSPFSCRVSLSTLSRGTHSRDSVLSNVWVAIERM